MSKTWSHKEFSSKGGKKRWEGVSEEERKAHTRKMGKLSAEKRWKLDKEDEE